MKIEGRGIPFWMKTPRVLLCQRRGSSPLLKKQPDYHRTFPRGRVLNMDVSLSKSWFVNPPWWQVVIVASKTHTHAYSDMFLKTRMFTHFQQKKPVRVICTIFAHTFQIILQPGHLKSNTVGKDVRKYLWPIRPVICTGCHSSFFIDWHKTSESGISQNPSRKTVSTKRCLTRLVANWPFTHCGTFQTSPHSPGRESKQLPDRKSDPTFCRHRSFSKVWLCQEASPWKPGKINQSRLSST